MAIYSRALNRKYTSFSKYSLFRNLYNQSFTASSKFKVLIICEPNRISYSQVYPFIYYQKKFHSQFDAQFRLVTLADFEANKVNATNANVVLLQTWFDIHPDQLNAIFHNIKSENPNAKIHYLDSFAPTDLRLAKHTNPHIEMNAVSIL